MTAREDASWNALKAAETPATVSRRAEDDRLGAAQIVPA